MRKMKVLVTRATFPDIIDRLADHTDVERNAADRIYSKPELITKLADKDGALISGLDPFDAETIAGARRLRAISSFAVGTNNLDLPALSQAGIMATNTPGLVDQSVADFTWGLMLAAARRVVESDGWLRTGAWKGWAFDFMLGSGLGGKLLGIVGGGRIGRAVAMRAAAFGMRVAVSSRKDPQWPDVELLPLERLIPSADVISLHVPLTTQTRHLIDRTALTRMKRSAYLINTTRGPVVDEGALAWALKEHLIAGAALDVFEREPEVHPDLLGLENVLLSPHLGSATRETRTAMADLAIDNVLAVLSGQPALTPIT